MTNDPSANLAALQAALNAAHASDDPARASDLQAYLLGSLASVVDTDTWARLVAKAQAEVTP